MKRIVTALILIPVFIYVVIGAPQWLFLLVVAAVAALAFSEYSGLVVRHGIQSPGIFGYAAGLILLLIPRLDFAFVIIVAILALALSLKSCEMSEALPFAGALVLGVLYTFGSLRCGVALRAISVYWLFFALSLNWAGDIVALYVGHMIGRHKLAPRISPGKSWEGSLASIAASMIYAVFYFPKLLPNVGLPEALAVAAIGNIAGQFGDLAESALKRGAGVKDSGSLLPGHGGWLDRIDSSLFALPVVYFLLSNLEFRP